MLRMKIPKSSKDLAGAAACNYARVTKNQHDTWHDCLGKSDCGVLPGRLVLTRAAVGRRGGEYGSSFRRLSFRTRSPAKERPGRLCLAGCGWLRGDPRPPGA